MNKRGAWGEAALGLEGPQDGQAQVRLATQYIAQYLGDPAIAQRVADAFRMTPDALGQQMLGILGISLEDHILQERMRHAQRLLVESSVSVAGIAREVGYASPAAFSTAFKRYSGVPPLAFRKNTSIADLAAMQGAVRWG